MPAPAGDPDRGLDRVTSVGVLIGVVAAIIAGATIWLLLTDPVTVANAVEDGEISPLVRQLGRSHLQRARRAARDYL